MSAAPVPIRASGFFAIRAPALPVSVLSEWADGVEAPGLSGRELAEALERDRALLEGRLRELLDRSQVRAAIAVASPDLCAALRGRTEGASTMAAAVRYIGRMAGRATPFGLFAGCAIGEIGDRTDIRLPPVENWLRHTRLDAGYLDAVVAQRQQVLADRLPYVPNPSIVDHGDRLHFVASKAADHERTHHLVQVDDSVHLRRALAVARRGVTREDLVAAVAERDLEWSAASQFVDQLIAAQVVVPDLAVTITGRLPQDALIGDLVRLGDTEGVTILRRATDEMAAIDADGVSGGEDGLDRVAELLSGLPVDIQPNRLLQVDLTIPGADSTIARSVVNDIAGGVELLRRFSHRPQSTELDDFRVAFRARYEDREVPLLVALDDEQGVGFGRGHRGRRSPLLEGLPRPAGTLVPAPLGARERRLQVLLQRAAAERLREIVLDASDVEALTVDEPPELPPSLAAIVTLVRMARGPRVVLGVAAGPSGANMLGRFCHADDRLAAAVRDHLREEEALDPDALHAEIVHDPAGRMVNLLARPVLREYEIEWLGRSGAAADRRIPASDLLVSLWGDRFVLRSAALQRRVVPRLTSAHNVNRRSPGVYRFLAAVQAQGSAGLEWSWWPLDAAPYRPRVRHGNVVLARASWLADAAELASLDRPERDARWEAVQTWRDTRRLPRWICVVDGGNRLPVDLDNVLSVEMFVALVRRRFGVLLEEMLPAPEDTVAVGEGGPHAVELLVPFVRTEPASPNPAIAPVTAGDEVRRTFPPGSEWTYLQLFCGPASADQLLRDSVRPLAAELIGSGRADGWFFIRYDEGGQHLRLRFHGDPAALREPIDRWIAAVVDADMVYDVRWGTYRREVERYGGAAGVVLAEEIFHADSDAAVDLLCLLRRGDGGLDARWRMALLGADRLLRDLGLDQDARSALCRRSRDAFSREFQAGAELRRGLGNRFRTERDNLVTLLEAGAEGGHPYAEGIAVLDRRTERIGDAVARLRAARDDGRLVVPIERLAESYVHMWLDRLMRSDNRFHELVIYDLLTRLYQRQAAISAPRDGHA